MRRAWWLVVLIGIGCRGSSLPTVPPVPADERDHIGFMGEYRLPHLACAYQRLGVRWVRIEFRWDRIERQRGVFDWSEPDLLVRRARELGFRLIVTLRGTPSWANGGRDETVPPRDTRDWLNFIGAVIRRYAPLGVRHWLIWNEPNLVKYFTGTMDDYIDRILIPAARLIHEMDPSAQVGAPEMTHHWVGERYRWDLEYILNRALPYIDIVTQHTLAPPSQIRDTVDGFVYPILLRKGWLGRPFWITEAGWDTCGDRCGLDFQAHAYDWMLRYRRERHTWLQMVVFYAMWTGRSCSHDILWPDFTCENWHVRPAYWAVQRFLEGLPFEDPFPECHVR